MTKSELMDALAGKLNIKKVLAEQIISEIFDSMTDAMKRREGIEIRGLGSFTVREYKAYAGRNPRTGESVEVSPKRMPFFKVGKALKELVNAPKKPSDQNETSPSSTPR